MKQGIFKRIFLFSVVILVLAVAGAELYVTGTVREDRIASLRDELVIQAGFLGREADFTSPDLDALARRMKETVHARVTIIGLNGKVLGDSDHASATMDNHRSRLEVQQADLAGSGMAVRQSDTLHADMLYVAKRIERNGVPQGFLRLSVTLEDVDAAVNRIRIKIIGAVFIVMMLTGLFLLWQVARIRRLTLQLRDFATALTRGDLGRRLFLHGSGEFEEIAEGMNAMALSIETEVRSLRDEKAKFETALLGISDGVLLLDQDGRVALANRAFLDLFSIAGGIAGRPFLEVVRNHELADLVQEAHVHHRSASGQIDIASPKQLSLLAAALPIIQESMRDDRYRGTVVALHDITQLKKLEQVRKDFVANVSHELRTPITAIQGFAETLLAGALDDRDNARTFLETIRSNSERINRLVDDLMTLSKIELGVIAVEKSDVPVDDVADAVLALFRDRAAKKGLSLSISIPHDLGTVRADRDRLVQIVTNLVDNAIKFTDKGEITIGASEEDGRVVLFVQDTGTGIPAKHLARLGERFYRVDTARSRQMGGTGLGLAIVKHLVKAHGWEMRFESTVGKGTTVRIFLA